MPEKSEKEKPVKEKGVVVRCICSTCKGNFIREVICSEKLVRGTVTRTRCPECEKNETVSFLIFHAPL